MFFHGLTRVRIVLLAALFSASCSVLCRAGDEAALFESTKDWAAIPAPGTALSLSTHDEEGGPFLRMDYDFADTKYAYVVASLAAQRELFDDCAVTFEIRRTAPANHLEFKAVDAATNAYRHMWYSCGPVGCWEKVTVPRRALEFAWGPSPGKPLENTERLEIAITGGHGKGRLDVRNLIVERGINARKEWVSSPAKRTGCYPRWFWSEQAYWTLAGVPDDESEALICEDGIIEPHKYGFSVVPVLQVGRQLITRDDVQISQSLADEYLPIPTVTWKGEGIELDVTLVADGKSGASSAFAQYRVRNSGTERVAAKLLLMIEPYQVYPPWHNHGGFSAITSIRRDGDSIVVNEDRRIELVTEPDAFGACAAGESAQDVVFFVEQGEVPPDQAIHDGSGFGSGVLVYDVDLAPRETSAIHLIFPLHDEAPDAGAVRARGADLDFSERVERVSRMWHGWTDRVRMEIPDQKLVRVLRSNIAYNLITRDGAGFQPGSRSYDRIWMRDGAVMGVAMLRMGLREEPRAFVDLFAGCQFDTGEIPPIIDPKAEDPLWPQTLNGLIEYDSQGQFVWAVREYYQFTQDRRFLKKMFGRIVKALEFQEALRSVRMTAEYREGPPEKRMLYGILPASDSHEGYKMKHSYWDDFWALRGWRDGAVIARELGEEETASWCDAQYEALRKSVYESVTAVMQTHGLDRIPGCAELGDVDPPAVAAIATYCGELWDVFPEATRNTFNQFYEDFSARWDDPHGYAFGPYEIRTVPALVIQGEREKALAVLRKMTDSCRPANWNHLAEVVRSGYRTPGYIGDMPHTWIGADYINAMCTLFAYEEPGRLILGQGLDPAWIASGKEVGIENLSTHYGMLGYMIVKKGQVLRITATGRNVRKPEKGFLFRLPGSFDIASVEVDGRPWAGYSDHDIVLAEWPREIVVTLGRPEAQWDRMRGETAAERPGNPSDRH